MKAKVATGDQYKDYSYQDFVDNPGLYALRGGGYVFIAPPCLPQKATPLFITGAGSIEVYSQDNPVVSARKISGTLTISV